MAAGSARCPRWRRPATASGRLGRNASYHRRDDALAVLVVLLDVVLLCPGTRAAREERKQDRGPHGKALCRLVSRSLIEAVSAWDQSFV